jgi:hypothetical protein
MSIPTLDLATEHLTEAQGAALQCYCEKLERHLPQFHITGVEPLKENLIQVWLESTDWSYQAGRKAAKLAVEVEDETGIFIILR